MVRSPRIFSSNFENEESVKAQYDISSADAVSNGSILQLIEMA